jgi:hypothetical protein
MEVRYHGSYRPAAGQDHGFSPVRLATGRSFNGDLMLQVEVFYRRLLIAVPVGFVALYLGLTGGLYAWLARNPHNQIAWRDLALPWHWSELTAKRGDTAVLAALDELRDRRYAEAYHNLRVGLVRSPGNVAGRLALAQLLVGQEPAQAVRIMEEGLAVSAGDDRLVSGLLELYTHQQIQASALAVLANLGAQHALTPTGRLMVERKRFELLLQLGRRVEAEELLPAIRELNATAAAECELALRVQQRQWANARQLFETQFADASPAPGLLPVVVELAVGTGETEWLQRLVRRLKSRAPESPGPHLLAVHAWHRMNRPSLRDAAEREYYAAFAGNEAALQSLAALAVQLQLPDLIGRAGEVARDHGFSGFAFQVHRTELALRRQQWAAASQEAAGWEDQIGTLPNPQRPYPELIRRLAFAAASGAREDTTPLLTHLAAHHRVFGLSAFLMAADVLQRADRPAVAAEVLQIVRPLYPQSDPLMERQRVLQARLEELAPARAVMLPVTPATSVPAAAVAAGAMRVEQAARAQALRDELSAAVATPAAAWAALDRAQTQADWTEAERLLKYLRENPPAWLPEATVELRSREVILRLAMDQRPLALVALKELVSKGGVARGAAFKLVRDLRAREDDEQARLLAQEISRLLPDDQAAARLLKETTVPPPAK